jgi:hypothetical protein
MARGGQRESVTTTRSSEISGRSGRGRDCPEHWGAVAVDAGAGVVRRRRGVVHRLLGGCVDVLGRHGPTSRVQSPRMDRLFDGS